MSIYIFKTGPQGIYPHEAQLLLIKIPKGKIKFRIISETIVRLGQKNTFLECVRLINLTGFCIFTVES